MLLHETLTKDTPSPLVVGAALVTLGLPQVFRLGQSESEDPAR